MKTKITLVAIFMMAFGFSAKAQFGGGTGTAIDPYKISTPAHLVELSTYVISNITDGKFFKMQNDIDMSGITDFTPIGGSTSSFGGVFDGNDFKITNLVINKPANDYVGLFGYITGNAKIQFLGVTGYVTGRDYVGGLVGEISGNDWVTSVFECYSTSNVNGNNFVGGLIGNISTIYNYTFRSYATGNVAGVQYVGGYAGRTLAGNYFCFAKGNISGSSDVGGFFGLVSNGGAGYGYAMGSVSGSVTNIGGFTGQMHSGHTSCYAAPASIGGTGAVKGTFVGRYDYGTLNNNYCLDNVSGVTAALGYIGTTSYGAPYQKTVAQLKSPSMLEFPGTDGNSLNRDLPGWAINENRLPWIADQTPNINQGYPILRWQIYADVVFNSNEGSLVETIEVKRGNLVTKPTNPTKEGLYFHGWFIDNETFAIEWNFNTNIVKRDLTLYAKWGTEVSINEHQKNPFSIYPNPTTNQLRITNYENYELREIEIYDISGKLVLTHKPINLSTEETINVSSLKSGIYFVKINNQVQKFIKQ